MASVMEKSQAGKGTGVLEGSWSQSTGGETAASGLASSAQLPGEVAGPTAGPPGSGGPTPCGGGGGRHAVGGWSRCTAGGDVPAPASPARSLPGAAALAAVTSVFPSHRRFTNGPRGRQRHAARAKAAPRVQRGHSASFNAAAAQTGGAAVTPAQSSGVRLQPSHCWGFCPIPSLQRCLSYF